MTPVQRIAATLRNSVEQQDVAPAFDRRSLPVYGLLGLALAIELAVLGLSDFHLGRSGIVRQFFWLFLFILLALYLRRRHLPWLANLLEALALPGIAAGLGVTGSVFMAAVSGPFVDAELDAADRLLGFDFEALLAFYRHHPDFGTISRFCYASFAIQAALAPSLLALSGQRRRMWQFMTAWCFSLGFSVLCFPFAPAAGPYVLHGIQEDVFVNFKQLFPWMTGPAIEALRDGSMRDIGEAARGLISIPSFHAVGGVLFAWAAWSSRLVRWPALALNVALIASTVVTGAHYLVDLIAGVALAWIAIVLSGRALDRLDPAKPETDFPAS